MDIIHHTLIGGTGFVALSANNQELAGMAFLAGSVFPDLDVVFMALGKRFYLRNHQGPTHSILLSPLYALLLISPAIIFIAFDWRVYIAALLGLWLHVLLDYSNTYGITLFWPFWRDRQCLDAVFFIDSVTYFLTATFYIQALYFPSPLAIYLYAGLFLSYVIFKYFLHKKVIRDLNCAYAIPSSSNPFTFFILSLADSGAKAFVYNTWIKKMHHKEVYAMPDSKYLKMAESSEVFTDMRRITKYFFITDILESDDDITITAHDIGVRNFGGRFGKTILRFDKNGGLIDEVAHI